MHLLTRLFEVVKWNRNVGRDKVDSKPVQARWRDTVISESADVEWVDGYAYFPRSSVRWDLMVQSHSTSGCFWKGLASYYDVVVDGHINRDAAWSYQDPNPAANHIKGMIAFWRGVEICK